MRIFDVLISLSTVFTIMRTSVYSHKYGEGAYKNIGLDAIYRKICRDIEIDGFTTINRPDTMDLALIEKLGFIGPASCIPFDEDAISDQCKEDINALRQHRETFGKYMAGLRTTLMFATRQMQKQIGYPSVDLSNAIGENLATKIANRNIYFINYGNCPGCF